MLKIVTKDLAEQIHIAYYNCEGIYGSCSHLKDFGSRCDVNGPAIDTLIICNCPADDTVSGYKYLNGTQPGDELKTKEQQMKDLLEREKKERRAKEIIRHIQKELR